MLTKEVNSSRETTNDHTQNKKYNIDKIYLIPKRIIHVYRIYQKLNKR